MDVHRVCSTVYCPMNHGTAIVDHAHFSFGPKVRLYVVFERCVVVVYCSLVPYSHCEHACPVHVQARFPRSDCYMYVHRSTCIRRCPCKAIEVMRMMSLVTFTSAPGHFGWQMT